MRNDDLFEIYRGRVEQEVSNRVLIWSEIERIIRRLNFRVSSVDLSRHLKESKIDPSSLGITPINTMQTQTYFYPLDKIWNYLTRNNGEKYLKEKGIFDAETLIEFEYHKPICRKKF